MLKGRKRKLIVSDKDKIFLIIALLEFLLVVSLANFFLGEVKTEGIWEWLILSVVFFFVTPLFTIKKIFKENPKEYFLQTKIKTKEAIFSLVSLVIFIVVTWFFVVKLGWKGELQVSSWVLGGADLMLFIDLVVLPIVIFSQEFFFRGFLLRKMIPSWGVANSIIIQAFLVLAYEISFAGIISWKKMIFIFMPNILFGFVAYKNRSIVISTILHWAYVLFLDIFFYYQLYS